MTEFRYLTFDCYGTLIDWKTGIEQSLRKAFGELPLRGKELLDAYVSAEKEEEESYRKYREVLRRAAARLSRRVGFEASQSGVNQFAESVPTWPAFSDTREALEDLGKRGYKRYILSNVDMDLLLGSIKNSGLEVEGFVTAEEVGSYKPDQAHWERFMQKTAARKGELLHVAQSVYHDILPTQRMGIQSAWVNRYTEPLPPNAQPSYIVDSLRNLAGILD